MTRRILLLRGVNVGGHGRLPMAELRQMLADLGLGNPRTLIASGNAVFDDPGLPDLPARLSEALANRFGLHTDLFLMEPAELQAVHDGNPFAGAAARDGSRVHVFFLSRPTTLPAMAAALATTEVLHLTPAALYLHAPDGIGRSKLAERLPRLLQVPVTARNWNTVTALLAMARD